MEKLGDNKKKCVNYFIDNGIRDKKETDKIKNAMAKFGLSRENAEWLATFVRHNFPRQKDVDSDSEDENDIEEPKPNSQFQLGIGFYMGHFHSYGLGLLHTYIGEPKGTGQGVGQKKTILLFAEDKKGIIKYCDYITKVSETKQKKGTFAMYDLMLNIAIGIVNKFVVLEHSIRLYCLRP
eukprot:UN34006